MPNRIIPQWRDRDLHSYGACQSRHAGGHRYHERGDCELYNWKVQIVAQLLLMTAAVAIAVVTIGGVVTTWWLFGLLLLHGFAGAIGGPAQQTLIHSMVGPSKLLSAVSLNSTARQFSQVIGPAVAGFIVVAFGPGWGFLINALTVLKLITLPPETLP